MKIIVIDDDKAFAEVMVGMLEAEGCGSTVAQTLPYARELLLGKEAVDAIFLDIWMDEQISLGLLDELQTQAGNIPVFLMSGGGGHLSLHIAASIAEVKGIAGFLQKPVRRARIAELVSKLKGRQ
jgi:DNA-binding NtrC family response regulator